MNADPKAWVHSVEWRKVLDGDPGALPSPARHFDSPVTDMPVHLAGWAVAVDANYGDGFKVMTIDEWTTAWKVNRLPPLLRRGCAPILPSGADSHLFLRSASCS